MNKGWKQINGKKKNMHKLSNTTKNKSELTQIEGHVSSSQAQQDKRQDCYTS